MELPMAAWVKNGRVFFKVPPILRVNLPLPHLGLMDWGRSCSRTLRICLEWLPWVEFNFILGNHLENLGRYHFFEVAGFTYLGDGFKYFFLKKNRTPKLGKIMIQFDWWNFSRHGLVQPTEAQIRVVTTFGEEIATLAAKIHRKNVKVFLFFGGGWAAGTSYELDLVCFGGEYMQMRTINLSMVDLVKVLFWWWSLVYVVHKLAKSTVLAMCC